MRTAKLQEELIAVFCGIRWRSDTTDYLIGTAKDTSGSMTTVCGNAPQGVLIPEVEYRFLGQWESHPKFGRQFKFTAAVQLQPHSRMGVVSYLEKYAPNIGFVIAGRLFDLYGTNAVKLLRTDPARVSVECKGLSQAGAFQAAEALQKLALMEDVRIDLGNLFAQAAIPAGCIEECLSRWKEAALDVVKRDPFRLLTADIKWCGFARCDTLYSLLGYPPERLKRQTICVWYICDEMANGSTWMRLADVRDSLKRFVSVTKIEIDRAVELGVRARWLETTNRNGTWYVAHAEHAEAERSLARAIKRINVAVVPLKGVANAEPVAAGCS